METTSRKREKLSLLCVLLSHSIIFLKFFCSFCHYIDFYYHSERSSKFRQGGSFSKRKYLVKLWVFFLFGEQQTSFDVQCSNSITTYDTIIAVIWWILLAARTPAVCRDMLWIKLFTQKPSQNVKTILVCLLQHFFHFPHGFLYLPWINGQIRDLKIGKFPFWLCWHCQPWPSSLTIFLPHLAHSPTSTSCVVQLSPVSRATTHQEKVKVKVKRP